MNAKLILTTTLRSMLVAALVVLAADSAQAQHVEAAHKTVSLLEKIDAGGVPLICLTIATVCGIGFYWQLKRNVKQHEDHLAEVKTSGAAQLVQQGELLREMLDRDREGQEAHNASTRAIEGVTNALKELRSQVMEQTQRCSEQLSKFDSLSADVHSGDEHIRQLVAKIDSLSTELRLLREDIRGRA